MKTVNEKEFFTLQKTEEAAKSKFVAETVSEIINNVRQNGDSALFEYAKKFDKAELTTLLVTEKEIEEAFKKVPKKFIKVLLKSAKNIRAFHSRQVRKGFSYKQGENVMGQKIIPIERAGLYVPGGTAAYPSTVLMDAIPAKIAGCKEVCRNRYSMAQYINRTNSHGFRFFISTRVNLNVAKFHNMVLCYISSCSLQIEEYDRSI